MTRLDRGLHLVKGAQIEETSELPRKRDVASVLGSTPTISAATAAA